MTFEGEEHALNSNSGEILRGHDPALTVGSDGRVLIVYEGAEPRGLCYFSGTLNSDGELDGRAHALIDGEICSGYSPAAVLDSTGRAVVIYQEPRSRELLGVTGFVVPSGRIVGRRRWLIHGKTRCGDLPAIAADQSGRLIVAYEANRAGAIQVVSGSFGAAGWIEDGAIRLPPGEERFGRHPTVAFDQDGCVILLHQTTSAHKLGYVHGSLRSGRLIGEERSLTIGMDRR